MAEALEPNNQFNKLTKHEIDSAFMAIVNNAFAHDKDFPNTSDTFTSIEIPPNPKPLGSESAINRAHSQDMDALSSELQRELNRKDKELLTSDLTGMPNREAFVGWLDDAIASNPSKQIIVGFVDIDKLKTINDTYGHNLADDIIRRVGKILSSGVRKGEDIIAAHRSGDEFLIGINGAPSSRAKEFTDSALNLINQLYIRRAADGSSEIIELSDDNGTIDRDNLHQVGASMGFASKHESMDSAHLMATADQAMYQAKESGRNRAVIFDA